MSDNKPDSDRVSAIEGLRRFWDWVIFIVKLLGRIGGIDAWRRTFQRLASVLISRFLAQQASQTDSFSSRSTDPQLAFYPASRFAFARSLEANWLVILDELKQLQGQHFIPWGERFLYKQGWNIFALYGYGIKIEENCRLCPATTRLLEQIPDLMTAAFSSLAPGTHIAPHVGYPDGVLRCHLGLVVPNRCGIRIGDEIRTWSEGKCLIFDDTIEHEAWNKSNQSRVVLLIDFTPQTEL